MKKKLKVGVIGIGQVAAIHLEAYRAHQEVEVAALCDLIYEKANRAASELQVPNVYTDYRELIKQEDLDFIDICTCAQRYLIYLRRRQVAITRSIYIIL
jgi:predicted dehydrogenase